MFTPTVVAIIRCITIHYRLNVHTRHAALAYCICLPGVLAEVYILLMGPIQGPEPLCGYTIYLTTEPWITLSFFSYRFIVTLFGLSLNMWMTTKIYNDAKERRGANASMWTVKELSLAKSMFYQSVIPMFLSSLSIIEAVTKQIIAFNKIFSEIAHTLPYTVYFLTAFLPAIFLRRFRNAMIPQFLWRRLCTDNKLAFVHVPQVKVSAQSCCR